jgi:hypothetical protein
VGLHAKPDDPSILIFNGGPYPRLLEPVEGSRVEYGMGKIRQMMFERLIGIYTLIYYPAERW